MKNNRSLKLLNIVVSNTLERNIETPDSPPLKAKDPNLFKQHTPEKLKIIKLEPERSF